MIIIYRLPCDRAEGKRERTWVPEGMSVVCGAVSSSLVDVSILAIIMENSHGSREPKSFEYIRTSNGEYQPSGRRGEKHLRFQYFWIALNINGNLRHFQNVFCCWVYVQCFQALWIRHFYVSPSIEWNWCWLLACSSGEDTLFGCTDVAAWWLLRICIRPIPCHWLNNTFPNNLIEFSVLRRTPCLFGPIVLFCHSLSR